MQSSMKRSDSGACEFSQPIARKGPGRVRVSLARFLPIDQRRGIYTAFHEHEQGVQKLALINQIGHRGIEAVLRAGRDEEVGRLRQEVGRLRQILTVTTRRAA